MKRVTALLKSLHRFFSKFKAKPVSVGNKYSQTGQQNQELHAHIQNLEILLEKIRQSEERYRLLLELCTDYAYALRIEPEKKIRLEWATDSINQVTDFLSNDINGNGDLSYFIIHPEDKTLAKRRMESLLTGQKDICEFRLIDENEGVRWFRDIGCPIWDSTRQEIVQIYGVAQDITKHKSFEDKLLNERDLLRTLVDHLPDDIYVKDTQSRYLLVNEPLRRHLEAATAQDVLGKTDFDFKALKSAQRSFEDEQALLQSGQPLISHIEPLTDHINGNQKWVLTTKIPIRDTRGQVIGLVGMSRDITHLKMAEDALRRGRDFAEGIIDTAQVIILVLGTKGHIIRFNHYLEEISGYTLDEVQGKNWFTTFIPPEEWARTRSLFSQAINDVQTQGVISPIITKRGDIREIEWYDKTLKDHNNNTIGLLAIGQDITDRRRFEQERNQLFEAVRKQGEQLRALTQQLSKTQEVERKALTRELHDQIGQNLTALDLNLNIIQTQLAINSGQANEIIWSRIKDTLEIISQTGDRIRDVMTHLRPQILDDFGLIAALRWYTDLFASRVDFSVRLQAEELNIKLAAPVEDTLFRITQEALTNAAKHAQPNLVTLSINSYNDKVYLIISDDGVGFELADQAVPIEKRHWGLITMAERAAAIGGYCRVESQPGKGTRVIVEVPHLDHDHIS
ncbi:MAG: PAS domain S-box protein [Anaerolineaceae bacterium]|nr:PAS domain S-box protein [Anaerolineaceae bacterium]MCB9099234.1 PAS domain S-box protein [Anaerolineales bacterium]